jgi:LCP family protein required for cell wall assembly
MAAGEKPYTVYRGGRQKGKVPLQRRVEPPQRPPRGPSSPDGAGTPRRRPRTRWSWKRRIVLTVLVVVVFLVVWAVAGYLAVRGGVADANSRLRKEAPGVQAALTKQNGLMISNASDVLLLGTDHSDLAARAGDEHSDSMMLIRTDPSRHRLVYLSIPRDLAVDIPGYGRQKINAAFQIGGPALAVKTVQALFGQNLPVNHVVVVNFGDFVDLVNKVGGVDVNVPEEILSNRFDCPYSTQQRCLEWKGWRFHKGVQHMDGHRALIYSRIRENQLNPADTDVSRGARQQQVMQALMAKLASVSMFFRLPFVGGSLLKPISTDLSTNQFLQLAWIKFRAGDVLHCRLGEDYLGGGVYSPSEHNLEVVQMVLGNSAPQAPNPAAGPLAPGCVTGNQSLK